MALDETRSLTPEEQAMVHLLEAVWDVPVGLGLCDGQVSFVRVNQALANLDGLPIPSHYQHDTLHQLPRQFADGLRRAASGVVGDVEFVRLGRSVLAKLHAVLDPDTASPIGVGVVALDVTDERAACRNFEEANRLVSDLLADSTAKELALARLIDSVQEGVVLVDPTGRVKQMNSAAARIMGHPSAQLTGVRFDEVGWSNPDGTGGQDAAALLARAVEHPALFHGELHVGTGAGRTVVVADATALRDTRGRVEDVVVSLRDVTKERGVLDVARSNLEFQQQIIGIVGHDLRNPLATITGSISLLRRQAGLTQSSVASLDRIARSAARMARLISDLLDYARTRAPGGLPVVLAQTDLHAICRQSVDECLAAHPSTQIVLETEGDGRGGWDADRIEQALTNLIVNAVQHGGGGEVRVQSIASAEQQVEVRVKNGGAVIPAEVLPELFKAYRRGVRGGPSSDTGGLGLGLFIVEQIVAAHGGQVHAESSAGEGTTFILELPRSFPLKGP
ncbi:MAG TPA: PAS domain-containing sensor histidine kinase [Myxococcales bacterium]|jgi:PAS domain S-box-containing protein